MTRQPVLFIPGTLCTPAVFDLQARELESLAPCITLVEFTLEDHISKMADTAIEKIAPHGAAAIIGFSMGGMVAMEIARKAPQLIGKLALLNSSFLADSSENQAARRAHLQQAKAEGMESVIRQHYLDRYLHRQSATARKLIIDMACELGTASFEAQINAHASRPDSGATLGTIKCPTLILGAANDRLCPLDLQTRMHRLIENSKLQMLDACGHFSMLERPADVNRALRDWYLGG